VCLIRVCSGAGDNWFSDKPDSALPAIFRHSDTEHSTYVVESDVDEALTVAAHQLTNPSLKLDTQYALRIQFSDIEELGIPVSEQHLGEAGVVKVDHAHRDLIGNKEKMKQLVSLIRTRAFEGEDRIRRFNKYQLQLMIKRILAMGTRERPTHTAELCERLLDPRSESTIDRERTIRELAESRIPDHAIQPVAYQLFERRGSMIGSPTQDWFEALTFLRDRYRDHYLTTHFVG
jgi:hypothetical protein